MQIQELLEFLIVCISVADLENMSSVFTFSLVFYILLANINKKLLNCSEKWKFELHLLMKIIKIISESSWTATKWTLWWDSFVPV